MRYMLMVKATGWSEAGVKPNGELEEARAAYWQSLAREGALIAADKLRPSSSAVRIAYPAGGGEPAVVAGPFAPARELMREYAVIEAESDEDALAWALRMPVAREGGSELELRPLEEEEAGDGIGVRSWLEAELLDRLAMNFASYESRNLQRRRNER